MNPSSSSKPTSSSSSSSDEPFFLDWGSSVNVNDDLRHTIQSDIERIHRDIQNLQSGSGSGSGSNGTGSSNIKQEQNTSSQLKRDYAHAQSELIHLSRGANDERDHAMMNEEILSRLKESCVKEVIGVVEGMNNSVSGDSGADVGRTTDVGTGDVVTITPPRHTRGGNVDGDDIDDGDGTRTAHSSNSSSGNDNDTTVNNNNNNANANMNMGMVQDVLRRTREIKQLRTIIESKQNKFNECTSQLTQVTYDLNMATHGLDREKKVQSAWNDDVDSKQREWNMEKSRMKHAKDKLYRSRKLTGEYTQQHTNDLKSLGSMKETYNRNEMQWSNEHSTMMKQVTDVKTKLSNLTSHTHATHDTIQRLQQQFQQRDDIQSEQTMIQKERNVIQIKMKNELSIREQELMQQLTELENEIRHGRTVYDGLKRQRIELDHDKRMGKKEEMEIIQPAKNHMIQLSNRSEVLSKNIHDMQEQIRTSKQSFENEMTCTYKSSFNDLSNQVLQKKTHIKDQSDHIQMLKKEREEQVLAYTTELHQHENLTLKFQEAKQVLQEDVIDVLLEQRQREKMELKHVRTCEVERERVKMEMLQQGVEVIEATKRLENVLEEKIVKMQQKIDG